MSREPRDAGEMPACTAPSGAPDPGAAAGGAAAPRPGPQELPRSAAKRGHGMDVSTALLIVLAVVLLVVAYLRGGWALPLAGLRGGMALLVGILPRLLLGFTVAGLFTALVPTETVARWMGEGSGLRGILVGTAAGILTPGGPFVLFPLVAALVRQGAGPGPVAAYLTAWGLIPLHRVLVWEIPMLGATVATARVLASLGLPILAGVLTPPVLRVLQAFSRAQP